MSVLSSFMRNVRSPSRGNSNISSNSSPMLNELNINLRSYFNNRSQTGKKKELMKWVKGTLEVKNLVSKVARDMTGPYHFENVNPNESGRNKILKANRFAAEIQYKREKYQQNFDKLATGESFAHLGFINDKQLKDSISKCLGNRPFMESKETKEIANTIYKELKENQGFANLQGIDEDLLSPKKYRTIASSTMEILFDKTNIKGYIQDVGGEKKKFTMKETIRSTLEDVDGKVNGFTSIESAIVQLELLRFMWQNMMSLHKNGGAPDKVFILEDQIASNSYERIKEQLQKYKLVENKHGNMLITGKVSIEDLQQMDNMQFRDMGVYITSLLSKMWNIPDAIGNIGVKDSNSSSDTGGNSEKAYYETVEFYQERDAEIDNLQLWIPYFGVRIVYDKQYVQKDVQELTAKNLLITYVNGLDESAKSNHKRLRFEEDRKSVV